MTRAETRALLSLLDVVDELATGLAYGATPTGDWAERVRETFEKHRRELRGDEVEWENER